MNVPHKHAALIKAWADGAEIELLSGDGKWYPCTAAPSWGKNLEYRVKPTHVPLWEVAKKAWYFSECRVSFDEVTTKSRWQTVAEAVVKAYEEQKRAA